MLEEHLRLEDILDTRHTLFLHLDCCYLQDHYGVKKLKQVYQTNGLTDTFDTLEEFKNKFQRHLSMKLNRDSYFTGFQIDNSIAPVNDDTY